ncbi:MAG: LPXTG cell wall anchor domain-containing protein [Streptococcus sp.]|nr:LPXTG cell wall anchor domain-containing protein [Streptococcus sp.]
MAKRRLPRTGDVGNQSSILGVGLGVLGIALKKRKTKSEAEDK